jgi:hypothetical protein
MTGELRMSTQLQTDTEAFYEFLGHQIQNGGKDTPPEELLKFWRQEFEEAVEDIREGIRNMEAGLGRPFEEVDAEMRKKYGIVG